MPVFRFVAASVETQEEGVAEGLGRVAPGLVGSKNWISGSDLSCFPTLEKIRAARRDLWAQVDKQEGGIANRYLLERRRCLGSEKYGKDYQDASGYLNRRKGNATAPRNTYDTQVYGYH